MEIVNIYHKMFKFLGDDEDDDEVEDENEDQDDYGDEEF